MRTSSLSVPLSVFAVAIALLASGCGDATGSPQTIESESADSFYFYEPPSHEELVRAKKELAEVQARDLSDPPLKVEPYYYAGSAGKYLREPQWRERHPTSVLPEPRYRSGSDWVTTEEFNKSARAYAVAWIEADIEHLERARSPEYDRFQWRREIIENVVEPCLDIAVQNNAPSNADPRAFKILLRNNNRAAQERLVDETIPGVRDLAKSERAAAYSEMRRECYGEVR